MAEQFLLFFLSAVTRRLHSRRKFRRKTTIGLTDPLPIELASNMKLAKKIAARGYLHEASQDYNLTDFLRPFLADCTRISEKKF